ncbi:endonuclease III domain-containing protein [Marinivivus vitaminiproducens]|uniref:endonuclease III domain-containing protein n=1 Tax=Marinivivus vitaminiproducens TaxID=3035935 RepID=UPI00279DB8B3|nr:hypothetical protein P4R82_02380 [Geminicoccaceae bacterium SCSIO 64248]
MFVLFLFLRRAMQGSFDFGTSDDLAWMERRLAATYRHLHALPRRSPVGQLARSLIGSRTHDRLAEQAFANLRAAFPTWRAVAAASPSAVWRPIRKVQFAEIKAANLTGAMRRICDHDPDFRLAFLRDWPLWRALDWLQRLPGIGPKAAAAVLNFSTLEQAAFVADTHVLRVLRRYGLIGPKADAHRAMVAVMSAGSDWNADRLELLYARLKFLGQQACRAHVTACGPCPLRARCRTGVRPVRNRT